MFKVFFLTVLLLCSCSDIGKEAKLSKIKALQSKLSKNKKSFEAMKVDTLFIMKQRSSDLERKLKQNYKSDSVDLNLGRRIDAYKRMRRMFGPLGALGTKLSNAFNEESLQLQHLYYDVENGFGPRDKYDEYIPKSTWTSSTKKWSHVPRSSSSSLSPTTSALTVTLSLQSQSPTE